MFDTPNFKNEEEEANWWYDNRDLVLQTFEQAAKDGTLGRGTLTRKGLTRAAALPLNSAIREQKSNNVA